jgi:hypothetical protein
MTARKIVVIDIPAFAIKQASSIVIEMYRSTGRLMFI